MTRFRSAVTAATMAAALAGSQAMAANDAPLAPGKPGGVKAAQHASPRPLLIMGAALAVVVGIGIAVAMSNDAQCGDACAVTPATS